MLEAVSPDTHNRAAVDVYGHISYGLKLSAEQFVHTIIVEENTVFRPALLVVDPYWLTMKHRVPCVYTSLFEDGEVHRKIRLFSVNRLPLYKHKPVTASCS